MGSLEFRTARCIVARGGRGLHRRGAPGIRCYAYGDGSGRPRGRGAPMAAISMRRALGSYPARVDRLHWSYFKFQASAEDYYAVIRDFIYYFKIVSCVYTHTPVQS
eukprot:SAG31_NODE_10778_length_1099_cov_1.450000_1_plen_105_part_01